MKKKSYTVDEIRELMGRYCAYQDRCHWEVERKLKSYSLIPQAEESILIWLIENDFVNEERFVRSFIRGKFNQKKWGRHKIRRELLMRQIPIKLIQIGMEEIDENTYREVLRELYEKKRDSLKSERESLKKKAKIRDFLLRKGFESELVSQLIFSE